VLNFIEIDLQLYKICKIMLVSFLAHRVVIGLQGKWLLLLAVLRVRQVVAEEGPDQSSNYEKD